MKSTVIIILALISLLWIWQRQKEQTHSPANTQRAEPEDENMPEDFDSFNKRFSSDSSFRISRILFPLNGEYETSTEKYRWTAENLEKKLYKKPVAEHLDTDEFQHKLVKTDTSRHEFIWYRGYRLFKIERIFKLKKNKWHLVYYDYMDI